jgi:hypothetical protein
VLSERSLQDSSTPKDRDFFFQDLSSIVCRAVFFDLGVEGRIHSQVEIDIFSLFFQIGCHQ